VKKCCATRSRPVVESSATRTVALVDLLVDTRTELAELMVRSGPAGVGRDLVVGSERQLRRTPTVA
jgi:hypothetical protein